MKMVDYAKKSLSIGRIKKLAVFISFLMMTALFSVNDSTRLLNNAILELWDDGSGDTCSSVVSSKKGYPFISIACEMDFGSNQRKKFLDTVFSYNAVLKMEDYQINRRSGIYLYKLEYPANSDSYVYVKLFFRNAYNLYPEKLQKYKKMFVLINGLENENQLFRWQTLGIPLAYGVLPRDKESGELTEKISTYNQEIWLALNLENNDYEDMVENNLNVETALDSTVMNAYLNDILSQMQFYSEDNPQKRLLAKNIHGLVFQTDSSIQNNIYAARSLLKNLHSRGLDKLLLTGFDSDDDVATTSEILGYKNYKTTIYIDDATSKDEIQRILNNIDKSFSANTHVILTIDADNIDAYNILRSKIRQMEKSILFIPISRHPSNKD